MEAKINGVERYLFSRDGKAHFSIYRRDKMICDCENGKELKTGFEIHETKIECPHCGKSYDIERPEPPKNSGMMNAIKGIVEIMVEEGLEVDPSEVPGTIQYKMKHLKKGGI